VRASNHHATPLTGVRRARSGGTGLGLALCKHFIETGHGGCIGATSQIGAGSEFYFVVPLTAADPGLPAPLREAKAGPAVMATSPGTRG
jgi:nitrogen-specific signal transduction histidine kinase